MYLYKIKSFITAIFAAATLFLNAQTRPLNLTAAEFSAGANMLTWDDDSVNGYYRVYCSTNGPITADNLTNAVFLEEIMPRVNGTTTWFHILSSYPETSFIQDTPFYYAVTVNPDPEHFEMITNEGESGWDAVAIDESWSGIDITPYDYFCFSVKEFAGNCSYTGFFFQEGQGGGDNSIAR
ncbi:MAG TPA: hypothetical protein VKS21_08580, partial [Spirochaetota bacterium]|nr:hypothetical protein [Spirochaetota bacterium]